MPCSLIEEINTLIRTKENPLTFENLNLKEILAQVREEFQTTLTNRHVAARGTGEPAHSQRLIGCLCCGSFEI